jgi:methylaspartate ammonia-lyase
MFADEVKTVTPKVEQMVSLHDQLTKKLDEKGRKIKMLTDEKNFAKMSKDLVDWVASKQAQMDQVQP